MIGYNRPMGSSDLKLSQLDDTLRTVAARPSPARPRGGWLKSVREALGITTRQFAARVGLAHSTVVEAEQGEVAETISLAQLRRLADALDCELYYVLIPRTPLSERVDAQAERKARERVAGVAHTMALEAQRAGSKFEEEQIAEVKDQLLRGRRSRLWD
jgi:predicted DNA-binding mobile mystery protein A